MQSPKLYATFLLWLLAELFEQLPEVGDPEKPKLVFFFDEAHLLFNEAPKALLDKIEQVVRLIRSKGVGVYFVTQNPLDVPETSWASSAIASSTRFARSRRATRRRSRPPPKPCAPTRSSTPRTRSPSWASAKRWSRSSTRRAAPTWSSARSCCRRAAGSARSRRTSAAVSSRVRRLAGLYEKAVDRESAYEMLKGRAQAAPPPGAAPSTPGGSWTDSVKDSLGGLLSGSGRKDSIVEAVAKSAARTIGSTVGREIVRGVLGSLLGGRRR